MVPKFEPCENIMQCHNKFEIVMKICWQKVLRLISYRNPSLGLATKAKAYKVVGQ